MTVAEDFAVTAGQSRGELPAHRCRMMASAGLVAGPGTPWPPPFAGLAPEHADTSAAAG